jgi:PPOX class probable F420-dependent enzyme
VRVAAQFATQKRRVSHPPLFFCVEDAATCIEFSMEASASFASFQGHKYLNLETLRKNGQAVRTPVWFAAEPVAGVPQTLYVYSTADSGKAKRIRNNSSVRVAPCDARGNLRGEWIEARATIVAGEEAQRGMSLLNKKYFPWKQLLAFFASFSRQARVVFAIRQA